MVQVQEAQEAQEAQEVQEAQACTAHVREVLAVLADWGSAKGHQEAAGEAVEAHFAMQEVQDHPSHLPPDRAALARLARPLTARPRPLPLQGH